MESSLTYDQWLSTYRPRINLHDPHAGFDGLLFETFGADWTAIREADPSHVWTLLDCDGHLYLGAGRHFVNRLGYFLCEVVWSEPIPEDVLVD